MKVLLDHNVPRTLRTLIAGHEVLTAREQGWDRLINGDLIKAAAEAGFQAMLTTDADLRYQQNEATLPLRIIIMLAKNNTHDELSLLIPDVLHVLAQDGSKFVEVGSRRK